MSEYDNVNRWAFRRLRQVSKDGTEVTSGPVEDYSRREDQWSRVRQYHVVKVKVKVRGFI